MLLAPYLTKSVFQKGTRKCTKNSIQKISKNESKTMYFFVAGRSPKSQKSEPWVQNVPQASRRGSQAPKILKNHQKMNPPGLSNHWKSNIWSPKNQENQIKKTSRIESPGFPNNPLYNCLTVLPAEYTIWVSWRSQLYNSLYEFVGPLMRILRLHSQREPKSYFMSLNHIALTLTSTTTW